MPHPVRIATMDYEYQLLLYRTVTPLHVGCGHDVGVVDLPVIRERTTGHPFVPGSGVRGALRARYRAGAGEDDAGRLFGPEAEKIGADGPRFAGSVAVHDARLLLFPVRTLRGVFAWLTCPSVLHRLASEQGVFQPEGALPALGALPSLAEARALAPAAMVEGGVLYLEEYAYEALPGHDVERRALADWAGRVGSRAGLDGAADRTVLVSDAAFRFFSLQATVVQQHNRLTLQKTVKDGALFSLEALPPECLLYGFVGGTRSRWTALEGHDREDVEGAEPAAEGEAGGGRETVPPLEILARLRRGVAGRDDAFEASLHLGGGESTGLGLTRLLWPAATSQGDRAERGA